jgi:NTE family protein
VVETEGSADVADRALVLGGGGVTGIAWMLGVLHGLAESGVDLTSADVVVGTSAGSAVGAQILSGEPISALYDRQLEDPTGEQAARIRLYTILRWTTAGIGAKTAQQARARIGRMALRTRTVPEAERRHIIESRLGVGDWPERRLIVTAVAAEDGEYVTFTKDSGVSLVDAVSASCAVPGVWPPMTVNGRRYVDGGVRSLANVDAAAGCDPVIVLAPIIRSSPRNAPKAQVAALPAGTRSLLISPDKVALAEIGRNVLDPARRGPAAKAGRRQAADVLTAVKEIWN